MNNFFKRLFSSIILLPLVFYIVFKGSYLVILLTLVCLTIASYEWYLMSKKRSYKFHGYLFLIISFYTFYKISNEYMDTFFVILICVSTDVGGYIFGKTLKGPKLTKISPNKTYAGMIGGYLLSLISIGMVSNLISYNNFNFKFFIIIIIISTVSQAGDILVSYFKRLSKLKNTGNIIPGHGGLLDRIDGMIFAFPTYYLLSLAGIINI